MVPVSGRVGAELTRQGQPRQCRRIAALRLKTTEYRLPVLLELRFREGWFLQNFRRQFEAGRQVLTQCLDRAAFDADRGRAVDAAQFVGDLFAIAQRGAAHQHGTGGAAGGVAVLFAGFIAPAQIQIDHHCATACLAWQQCQLHAAGKSAPDHPGFNVLWCRLEGLALLQLCRPTVIAHQRLDIRTRRYFGPLRAGSWNESAAGAIGGLEILQGHPLHLCCIQATQLIAL